VSARILAVDTTGEHGSLALLEDARVVEEIPLHSPEGFAHIVFGEIEALLARHSVNLREIDCFASASGPGAFTGVRVGLAAVKGLAEATGRKVVAVSNLQAVASFGTRALRAPVIDARRGEIFGAVYDAALHPVCTEAVMKFADWVRTLPTGDLEIVALNYPVPEEVTLPVAVAPLSIAGAIGRIAAERLAAGEARDPAEIDANYVRRSDAELFWRER
jgi:tRNA threonylcarbamoyladenosine biosynthesis protein TsaB